MDGTAVFLQTGRELDGIRSSYRFDPRTSYSVPPAIMAFLQSTDYEDAVRKAVSLGGDADTMACIAGGIAEAYYGEIPVISAASAMQDSIQTCERYSVLFMRGIV